MLSVVFDIIVILLCLTNWSLYYEQMLQMISLSMRSLGPHAMLYLAAAVSDFYVPWKSMVMVKYVENLCCAFYSVFQAVRQQTDYISAALLKLLEEVFFLPQYSLEGVAIA